MFLRQYSNIQLGLTSPETFRRAEETRKVFTLDYDKRTQLPDEALRTGSTAMCVDPTARFLLTGYKDGGWSIVDCWNTTIDNKNHSKFKLVKTNSVTKQKYLVSSVSWFSDNGSFAICSLDGSLNIFDTNNSDKPLCSFGASESEYHEYVKHAANPSNPLMIAASCAEEKQVFFIDLRIGSEIQSLPAIPADNCFSRSMTWSPASEYIIAVGTLGGHLLEWDTRSTRQYLQGYCNKNIVQSGPGGRPSSKGLPVAHRREVASIKYTEDGHQLFSYAADQYLHKFSTATCILEESVCILDRDVDNYNHWPIVSIHVFDHLEIPLVVVPRCSKIYLINMTTGLGEVVSRKKCHWSVDGFTYNRTLLKGFTYGTATKVFSANQNQQYNEEDDEDKMQSGRNAATTPLVDFSDL